MSRNNWIIIVSLLFSSCHATPGVCESDNCPGQGTALLQKKTTSAQAFANEDSTNHSNHALNGRCETDTGGGCTVTDCDASRSATCVGDARRRWDWSRRRMSCVCVPPACNVGGECKDLSHGDGYVPGDEADKLTILLFNTYLLEFLGTAGHSLDTRSRFIADWFKTLNTEALPDVLVLNEIYSDAGEALVQNICTDLFLRKEPIWGFGRRRGKSQTQYPFMPCRDSSPFAYTTLVNNPRTVPVLKSGGVVILVRKGVTIEAAYDKRFTDLRDLDMLGSKGFWAVKAKKENKQFWVIGTHTHPYAKFAEARQSNFAQMRAWVDHHVEDGSRLVFAGDMNVLTQPFVHHDCTVSNVNETADMTRLLGGQAPVTGGTLEKNGFWLPLDTPLSQSWHTASNHFATHLYPKGSQGYEGDQMLDWVLAPGSGDRLEVPREFKRQVVPVLSSECFSTTFESKPEDEFTVGGTFQGTDLSDHYGIFALLCYNDVRDGSCTWPVVEGHRGVVGTVPSPVDCGDVQPLTRSLDCGDVIVETGGST